MIEAAKLAGYLAAHAVERLSAGRGHMLPQLAFLTPDGRQEIEEVSRGHDIYEMKDWARKWLGDNRTGAVRGAMARYCCGWEGIDGLSALLITPRDYTHPWLVDFGVVVTYCVLPPGRLWIDPPEFHAASHGYRFSRPELLEPFLEGVSDHATGHRAWEAAGRADQDPGPRPVHDAGRPEDKKGMSPKRSAHRTGRGWLGGGRRKSRAAGCQEIRAFEDARGRPGS